MSIRKNFGLISMPRSGQHFLARAIIYYLDNLNIKNHYCVYYKLCENIPCNCAHVPDNINIVFQKNHDFDLKIRTDIQGVKYLYLFRDSIINCIEANYRLKSYIQTTSSGGITPCIRNKDDPGGLDKTSNINIKYNDIEFEKFKGYFKNLAPMLLKTKKKWLKTKNTLIVIYEELINNFEYYFTQILSHFDIPINIELIQKTKVYCNPHQSNKKRFTVEQINILNSLVTTFE